MISNVVIIDSEWQVKEVIIDLNLILDIVVDDVSVMFDILLVVIVVIGMDVLIYVIEVFVFVGVYLLIDVNVFEVICLINLWLLKVVDDGYDLQVCEQMVFGQYLVGMVFNSVGFGLVYVLVYQSGVIYNLLYGVCNVILLLIIENFNCLNVVVCFVCVVQVMGVDICGMSDEVVSMEVINVICMLSKCVGIFQGFSQFGVSKVDIEGWLDKVLVDLCVLCNLCFVSCDEVCEFYLEVL